jgi:chromosome segregation ATPase
LSIIIISLQDIQKSFNFNLQDNLKKIDDYISDTFDIFEEEQDNIKQIFEEFKKQIDQHIQNLFNEKLKFSVEQIGFMFESCDKLIANMNTVNQECVKSLKRGNEIAENLSKIIMPSEKRITSKLEESKTKTTENFKKKIVNLENSITNLNKETKKILSNLKAAILVLEGSKEPIFYKIEKLENEKKNLLSNIKEIKSEKQDLMNQIKELKKGG